MDGLFMKYFVLKPRGKDAYASASRAAMIQYAKFIREENPELSKVLWDWVTNENIDANDETLKEIYEAHSDGRSAHK